ncbi:MULTISPECIES: MurR/RpiR family transcriptional regulator [Aerococcus]|uniref:MurR/RpiR family transcriptional regulator n=2 Tax=Aerococcus TaxID=1375 RepID=A0A178HID6_9LACT|nr:MULTISPECIES: MurR/RpiR family transcriptional regulator [Aerococcus]KAA9219703.1 MurR/RpiR family transcriptional regulator [Aerococcus loyolae]KAA9263912.1 MurR/RpiR family transcriptional regulator [Aerococcus loyolae]MCY3025545.1 MurR/RpiR family transcriptional regulator [Aerococcus loyolae]MCY3026509.1 MurR/RpiR family transcriptional regulator [Aerococcus loyolae]MCY3028383.1 MurR/RpiR family transcriptional regulator [Aerococcus loyolae]
MKLDRIISKYHLTDTEVDILKHLIQSDAKLTIRELAEKAYVSPATIIHLAKKMNFSGYSELLFQFNQEREKEMHVSQQSIIDCYGDDFYQMIEKYQDKLFIFMGLGFSLHLANYMSDLLNTFGFRSISNTYEEFINKEFANEAVIIFISHSGETEYLLRLAQLAHKNGVEYMVFTGNPSGQLQENAQLTIDTKSFSIFRYKEYKPQVFFGLTLIYFEELIADSLKRLDR